MTDNPRPLMTEGQISSATCAASARSRAGKAAVSSAVCSGDALRGREDMWGMLFEWRSRRHAVHPAADDGTHHGC
ncbi:hypothetical protein G6F55_014024 [Rhizopus delemar]|nr:hypothetical protein G6F31_020820 [Rhizopus arrhizus]KAG1437923.1 hypothetical protein G6F55_014024 [Rhizopus delemar]